MSQLKRKILFLFFLFIFIVATPILSLYATGYKIGSNFKIQKTGILIIDTKPEEAKIYIDGKLQVSFLDNLLNQDKLYIKTPAKIKNIKPGDYTIKLELDNYWTWQKKLTIHPGKSTFIEDINLFKNNFPILINKNNFDTTSFSDNKKLIAGNNNYNTTILDTESEDFFEISSTTLSTSTNILNWSPKNKYLLTKDFVIDVKNKKTILSLEEKIGNSAKNVEWLNDDKIIFQNNNAINKYDINENSLEKIIELNEIDDFLIKNNKLFIISTNNHDTSLIVWDIKDKKEYRKINLPKSNYVFINKNHKFLNIYDNKHNILYLIDPFSYIKTLREVISNIKLAKWINENKLLYANDFEIWIYNTENYNKTLLTRVSKKLQNIIWHPSNNYVIFSNNKSIHTIELDNREKRNITTLLEFNLINNLEINEDGDILYFYGNNKNNFGIYKLMIQ